MSFLGRLFGGFGSKGSLSSYGKAYKLAERELVSRETYRLRFALETPDTVLGLPVGHHVEVRLPGGNGLSRAYTPVTGDRTKGFFDLVVKVYPQGRVSKYLGSLKVGDSAEIAGPSGDLTYKGNGHFKLEDSFAGTKREVTCQNIAMIAGGTGVTPMFQIAEHSLSQAAEQLQMTLLFANRTPEDVMLREQLDALAAGAGGARFRVDYTVDEVPAGSTWSGLTGRVSAPLLDQSFGRLPARPELICLCGPSGFHRAVKTALTEELGYDASTIFEF